MDIKSRHLKQEKGNHRIKFLSSRKGFSLVEIAIAVAVIGVMALVFYPNIRNTLETRKIENSAMDILTTLQRAKFQAVKTRLNHRVRFLNDSGNWFFLIEREASPTNWIPLQGTLRKEISSDFAVTVNFPNNRVEFSPLGFVSNFNAAQSRITLKSERLAARFQPDLRIIRIFAGGSMRYAKTNS